MVSVNQLALRQASPLPRLRQQPLSEVEPLRELADLRLEPEHAIFEVRHSKIACSGSSRRSASSRSGSTSLSGCWRKRGSGEAYQRRERPGKNRGGAGEKPVRSRGRGVRGPFPRLTPAFHGPLTARYRILEELG